MSYKYITKYTSPNQSGDFKAESITIHWWGEPKNHRSGGVGGVVNWLCQARARASAHFVVSGVTREIACIIGLNRAAWHSANWTGNHRSIGIEMHPWDSSTPKAQIEADMDAAAYIVALCWHWRPATKGKALKGHRDWHNTACPGNYYGKLKEIHKRATAIYPHVDPKNPGQLKGGTPAPKPTPKPTPKPEPKPTPKGLFNMSKINIIRNRKHVAQHGKWSTVKLNDKGALTLYIGPGNVMVTVQVTADIPPGATLQGRFYQVDFKDGETTKRTPGATMSPCLELTHTGGQTFGSAVYLDPMSTGTPKGRTRRLRFELIAYTKEGKAINVPRIEFRVMGE